MSPQSLDPRAGKLSARPGCLGPCKPIETSVILGYWFASQEAAWDRLHRTTATIQQPRLGMGEGL